MTNKLFKTLSFSYILLPIIIFFLGWLKLWLAIPLCIALLIIFLRIINNEQSEQLLTRRLSFQDLFPVIAIILLWVYFSGIGGLVFQNKDHWWRNEIFNLLVMEHWPVISGDRGLIYYIGFWLPSAVIGKIFGFNAGYLFQILWTTLGIFLVWCLMCDHLSQISLKPLLGLILFSGLDIVGCLLLQVDFASLEHFMHIEWWSGFQFSSFTTQLFWVFNQAIYAWVLTLLIMRQKSNRYIILIWSCGLLTCTLPFVGMLPFLLYKIYVNARDAQDSNSISATVFSKKQPLERQASSTKSNPKNIYQRICYFCRGSQLFTLENIIGGGCIGIICFLYEIGNISANNSGNPIHYTKGYLFLYILFLIIEVGLYAFVIYPYQKQNTLYWLCLIVLAACPLIHIGSDQDFCMRASIPALLVFMLLFFDSWEKAKAECNRLIYVGHLVLFLLGAVTPLCEIWRTTKNTVDMYHSGETIMAAPVSKAEIMDYPNFSGNVDESLFFKYLGR